jgi:hypothetical protein
MPKRIIYQTNEGGVAIIIPSGELPLEQVARKDVPAGAQFKIIDTVDVPDDRTFRNAWEADMTSPHGTGIGQQAWFIEQYEAEIEAINAEAAPQALVVASIENAELPEELTEDQRQAAYLELVAFVAAQNADAAAQFEESKAGRIAQLNTQIAAQRAEMAAA